MILRSVAPVVAYLALVACRPPCELRKVEACEFRPAHLSVEPRFVIDSDGDIATKWETVSVPDQWSLRYEDGGQMAVSSRLCEDEGDRRRYELRDGSTYSYHDQPVLECGDGS